MHALTRIFISLAQINAERPIEEVYGSVKDTFSELKQKHQGH